MPPVIEYEMEEEIDSKLLIVPVSPLSDEDNESEIANSTSPATSCLSNSFPSCLLSKALHDVKSEDLNVDLLSMSCFADLRLDKHADDGDLTSLDWLQDINLLKNISPDRQQHSDLCSTFDCSQKENILLSPYHPKCNPCGKPPYSFSVLIFMAIESSPHQCLPVKEIYEWIADQFPFYRRAPSGWRNSVRHNLSLNKCFRKVGKTLGKGSSWCIDPLFRPNLLQAMRRTPYFPFQQVQMMSATTSEVLQDDSDFFADLNDEECEASASVLSPHEIDMDVAATLASLGNACLPTMLTDHDQKLLKIRSVKNLPELVCTPAPSKDHVYGFSEWLVVEAQQAALAYDCDLESPVDEVYDFGEIYCDSDISSSGTCEPLSDVDSQSSVSPRDCVISRRGWLMPDDDVYDEEQRRLEGVRALLNLASGTKAKKSRCRPASGSLWAKAVDVCLKKRRKQKGRVSLVKQKQLNKSKTKNKKKVVRRRLK